MYVDVSDETRLVRSIVEYPVYLRFQNGNERRTERIDYKHEERYGYERKVRRTDVEN